MVRLKYWHIWSGLLVLSLYRMFHPSCYNPLIWESVTHVVIHKIEYYSSEESFPLFLCLLGLFINVVRVPVRSSKFVHFWRTRYWCGNRLFSLMWYAFSFTFKSNICVCALCRLRFNAVLLCYLIIGMICRLKEMSFMHFS